ncbi:MAG TPA: LPXTG cell wall anchor domain-containing protein [Thermoanaerobaculia bacterium]|nr:LPXTG cell wall anchor domain-containing protein [Thermoanaerobaculia bacterium]
MVDNVNPTSQFHPYQPQTAQPQTGSGSTSVLSGLDGILNKLGIDQSKISAMGSKVDLKGQLGKVRSMAQKNPNLVLGGLAALAIGAGLLRKRSMR